ncbi:MAG: glycine cleavage system protein GcvH [Terriglobia bacterium]
MIKFHPEHLWARTEGDLVVIGISDFAQAQLSDVTFVDLPQPGAPLRAGDLFGSIESAKALNDLFAPLSGEVVEVNPEVEEIPYIVNESPYERGWLIKIRPADPAEWDSLLTQVDYESRCQL